MWFIPRNSTNYVDESLLIYFCGFFQGNFSHWVDGSLLIYFYGLFQGNFNHWFDISLLIFKNLFQGDFTHWVDRSPLLDPDWNKHEETSFKAYAIYVLATNEVIRHDILNVSSLQKQPEHNIDKNCTALPVGHHLTRYSWIAIPCDPNITATYFCQSKFLLPIIHFGADLNQLNFTCDQGWF